MRENVAVIAVPHVSDDFLQSAEFVLNLSDVSADIEVDDEVRVVVVNLPAPTDGGADGSSSYSFEESHLALPGFCESIERLDRPTIAVIHGDAVGRALELAMACDIRIASDSSRFGLPAICHGLIPFNGGTQRLPRLVGKGKALEMILTGDLIDANEAHRIGLVNRIASSGSVLQTAMDLACEMATKAPISLRFVREAIHKGMDLSLDQGLNMEGDLYLLLYSTEDRVAGIESFRNKQKPLFKGK